MNSEAADVQLEVFDMIGRNVDGRKLGSAFKVSFEASNLSSGMHIYRMKTGNFQRIMKIALNK